MNSHKLPFIDTLVKRKHSAESPFVDGWYDRKATFTVELVGKQGGTASPDPQ